MIDSRIKDIIKNKRPCYFISPHLDDAALSAGELIRFLATKTSVTVINIFTQAGSGPQTLSAKKYIQLSGYHDAAGLFFDRLLEDQKALSGLGVKVVNLKYTDALWRRLPKINPIRKLAARFLPEFVHMYPIYQIHIVSGHVSSSDGHLVADLSRRLLKLVRPNSVVFCPLGVGNHVDHCLVRLAVENKFKPVLWQDQPYYFREERIFNSVPRRSFEYPVNDTKKTRLVRCYKTQVNQLFKSGLIPHLREKYYYE